MYRYLILILSLFTGFQTVTAQTKSAKDLYWEYTQYRNAKDKKTAAIEKSQELLKYKDQLSAMQVANVNYHIGRLYEESGSPEQSVAFYEECIKLIPGYYVPYRAIGFINVSKCNALGAKINEAGKQKNISLYNQALEAYKKQVLKTVPYLEKSQACDPDDATLKIIQNFYKNIKAQDLLVKLPERLKKISSNCVTLLEDN